LASAVTPERVDWSRRAVRLLCKGFVYPSISMYAEKALAVVNDKNRETFIQALTRRLQDVDKETKRKRIEKVILKLSR
jgi:predicted AlkP superfamily phosphohydrolase/phosphomutase